MSQDNKRSFILHGSILAMAGIIVRIIGMIYRIPMVNIIGSQGNGIYGTAFNVYNIMLVLSSYGLPMAVSKLISARFAKRRYKSAKRVFMCSISIAATTGGTAALLMFFGADFIEKYIYGGGIPGLAIPLRILAPTIFFVAILGTVRGFFQGQGTMIPTAVSQIIEQIVNAIVSILAGYLLIKAFADSDNPYAWGAAGSTLGTATGAFVALAFMLLLYFVYLPVFSKMVAKDRHPLKGSTSNVYRIVIWTMIPIILGQTFYQLSTFLDDVMFSNLMVSRMDSVSLTTDLGNYCSSFVLLIGIPQGIASAMSASMLPSIVASMALGEIDNIKNKITRTLGINMFVAIPCFVGLTLIGTPIIRVLFAKYDATQGGLMLSIGSIALVMYTLSTVSSSALQGIDEMQAPMIHSFISLVAHIIIVFVLLKFTSLGIFALVIGNMTFPILIFILNFRLLYIKLGYIPPVLEIFAAPTISAAVMGVFVWGAYKVVSAMVSSNLICLLFTFVVAFITYFGPYYFMKKKRLFEN